MKHEKESAMEQADYSIGLQRLDDADGGGWLATVAELPGCMSDGATHDEAIRNVRDAIDEWVDGAQQLGRPIPAPSQMRMYA